jgi:hypothetical protein
MGDTPETSIDPTPRVVKEYEDPHYHDEDEIAVSDDVYPRPAQTAGRRTTTRRVPPPKRRFHED